MAMTKRKWELRIGTENADEKTPAKWRAFLVAQSKDYSTSPGSDKPSYPKPPKQIEDP
jgi:hypothetical protein